MLCVRSVQAVSAWRFVLPLLTFAFAPVTVSASEPVSAMTDARAENVAASDAAITNTATTSTATTSAATTSASTTSTTAISKEEWRAQVAQLVQQRVAARRSKGLIIGWIRADDRGWEAAGESGNPARPVLDAQTRFEIGSISKTFTGHLLADAVTRGEVSLTHTLGDLRAADSFANPHVAAITLAELATHSSGLPRMPNSPQAIQRLLLQPNNPYRGTQTDEIWQFIRDYAPGDAPLPGRGTLAYSNLGAAALGQAIAGHLQTDYAALINTRLLTPLHMSATSVHAPLAHMALMAQGHKENLRTTSRWDLDAYAPAGGIWSNTEDMLRYLQAQLDGRVPGAALAQATQLAANERGTAMGLGWLIAEENGRRIWWHNGGTGGFRSFMAFDPQQQIGVIVLSNTAQDVDDLGWHLLRGDALQDKPAVGTLGHVTSWLFALATPFGFWRLRRHLGAPSQSPNASTDASATNDVEKIEPEKSGTKKDVAPEKPARSVPQRPRDRLEVIIALISAVFLLSVSWFWGAWQRWPELIWWTAAALSVLLFASMLPLTKALPNVGKRSLMQWLMLGFSCVFMLLFTAALWWS